MKQKQRVIIFVGPDRCGKTEIAKELSKTLGIPVFKASSEHETYLKSDKNFVEQIRHADPRMVDFLSQTKYSVIFDRGYPCEAVYSKVKSRLTDHRILKFLDNEYAKLNAKIILCMRNSYEGIVDDIDPTINSEILQSLHTEYIKWTSSSKCDVLQLNVDDEDINREINDIMSWLEKY